MAILRHLLLLTVVPLSQNSALALTYCQKGTYELTPPMGGKEVCELCLTNTFMPLYDHREKECFNCSRIEDPLLEILVSPCNRTDDAVIQCIEGYYRSQERNPSEKGVCLKCAECQYPYYEVQSCQAYSDTGCCPGENYYLYINGDGVPLCRKRPWFCRQGQYFSLESSQCLPCPTNTFMPLDYHMVRKCMQCQYTSEDYLPLHAIVTRSCNSTYQDVIRCADGYFLNYSMGYGSNDIGCSPCTRCSTTDKKYVGQECDEFHNSVCCPEPDMTVVDTSEGPKCQISTTATRSTTIKTTSTTQATECGRDQYLSINLIRNKAECKTCPPGTYMDEEKHTKPACKKCTDFREREGELPASCSASEEPKTHKDSGGCATENIMIALLICFGTLLLIFATLIFFLLRRLRGDSSSFNRAGRSTDKSTEGTPELDNNHELTAVCVQVENVGLLPQNIAHNTNVD